MTKIANGLNLISERKGYNMTLDINFWNNNLIRLEPQTLTILLDIAINSNLKDEPFIYYQKKMAPLKIDRGERFLKIQEQCKRYNISRHKFSDILSELKEHGYISLSPIYHGKNIRRGYIIKVLCIDLLIGTQGDIEVAKENDENGIPFSKAAKSKSDFAKSNVEFAKSKSDFAKSNVEFAKSKDGFAKDSAENCSIESIILNQESVNPEIKVDSDSGISFRLFKKYQELGNMHDSRIVFFSKKIKRETLLSYEETFGLNNYKQIELHAQLLIKEIIDSGSYVPSFKGFLSKLISKINEINKTEWDQYRDIYIYETNLFKKETENYLKENPIKYNFVKSNLDYMLHAFRTSNSEIEFLEKIGTNSDVNSFYKHISDRIGKK
jgi:hypothetical protein